MLGWEGVAVPVTRVPGERGRRRARTQLAEGRGRAVQVRSAGTLHFWAQSGYRLLLYGVSICNAWMPNCKSCTPAH